MPLLRRRRKDGALAVGDRVVLTADRPGIPAGTTGRVIGVAGLDWIRYRVRFDTGAEAGSLDARYLDPID